MSARFIIGGFLLFFISTTTAQTVMAQEQTVTDLAWRLAVLQQDPTSAHLAAYERLQAQQALDDVEQAKPRDREEPLYLALRRVEIAETTYQAAQMQQQMKDLERTRSDLLLESNRRALAKAQREAEQLRMQMQLQIQMQEEEASRLQQAAEAETLARQDAEAALGRVAGQQAARVNAAKQKEAALAREEAELVSGKTLPAVKFDNRGEVFTLAGSAFSGESLSASAQDNIAALTEYLKISHGRVRIEAFGRNQAKADLIKSALVQGGISASRLQATNKQAAATAARAVEIIVVP